MEVFKTDERSGGSCCGIGLILIFLHNELLVCNGINKIIKFDIQN